MDIFSHADKIPEQLVHLFFTEAFKEFPFKIIGVLLHHLAYLFGFFRQADFFEPGIALYSLSFDQVLLFHQAQDSGRRRPGDCKPLFNILLEDILVFVLPQIGYNPAIVAGYAFDLFHAGRKKQIPPDEIV